MVPLISITIHSKFNGIDQKLRNSPKICFRIGFFVIRRKTPKLIKLLFFFCFNNKVCSDFHFQEIIQARMHSYSSNVTMRRRYTAVQLLFHHIDIWYTPITFHHYNKTISNIITTYIAQSNVFHSQICQRKAAIDAISFQWNLYPKKKARKQNITKFSI